MVIWDGDLKPLDAKEGRAVGREIMVVDKFPDRLVVNDCILRWRMELKSWEKSRRVWVLLISVTSKSWS